MNLIMRVIHQQQ